MGMTDASPNTGTEFAELYEQADRLLYNAKLAGRNRTKIALARGSDNDADSVNASHAGPLSGRSIAIIEAEFRA
jgi:hypothetical protein